MLLTVTVLAFFGGLFFFAARGALDFETRASCSPLDSDSPSDVGICSLEGRERVAGGFSEMVDGRAEEVAMTDVDGADIDGVVETVEICGGRIEVDAEVVAIVVAALEDFSPFLESASTSLE